MSGIVGFINQAGQPVERELLGRLTTSLAFRGPDDHGVWTEGHVGLGHTMLRTTLESEREQQPCSLDGKVWITADARIDGRADLIRELEGRGCTNLKNVPDVELILHAYQVWGDDCVQHLIGDFAFAIWDGPRRRLWCARDHLGVKPFFYADAGRSLVFSNTLNCIRRHPDISDRLNDLAIADFLLFDNNQDPATTTFADIQRLPAAHSLTWQPGGAVKVRRYWSLPQEGVVHYPRQRDYVERFQELLRQAVADRLRTDKVGVLLSGGLDSPMVTAIARDLLAARSPRFDLQCYTMVFDHLIPDEERYYAGEVARHLHVPVEFLPQDDYAFYGGQTTMRRPEPRHDPRGEARTELVNLVASRNRLVLTGEGGDEILYPSKAYIYRLAKRLRLAPLAAGVGRCLFFYGHVPQVGFKTALGRWRQGRSRPGEGFPAWLNPGFAARLELPTRWERFNKGSWSEHPVRPEACAFLRNPLIQMVFEDYDPGTSGAPVEFRHPLLDVRLLSYALSLPPLPWCVDKIMLRELGKGRLPEVVRRRPKAPLAEYPELAMLRRPGSRWLDDFAPCEQLGAYVRRAAVPPVSAETDQERLWMNLRPLSLNYWLHNLKADFPDILSINPSLTMYEATATTGERS
ncbi:MAG: asparagine synthetase B family protein [Desulfobaccales bacterium]